jgi:hypothetical protein
MFPAGVAQTGVSSPVMVKEKVRSAIFFGSAVVVALTVNLLVTSLLTTVGVPDTNPLVLN